MNVRLCLSVFYIHLSLAKIKVCLSVAGFVLILSVCLSVCLLNSLSTTSPSVFCRQQQHQHHQQGRLPITSGWRGIYEDRFMGQRNEEMERKMRSRCQEDITSSTRVSPPTSQRTPSLHSASACLFILPSGLCSDLCLLIL